MLERVRERDLSWFRFSPRHQEILQSYINDNIFAARQATSVCPSAVGGSPRLRQSAEKRFPAARRGGAAELRPERSYALEHYRKVRAIENRSRSAHVQRGHPAKITFP